MDKEHEQIERDGAMAMLGLALIYAAIILCCILFALAFALKG